MHIHIFKLYLTKYILYRYTYISTPYSYFSMQGQNYDPLYLSGCPVNIGHNYASYFLKTMAALCPPSYKEEVYA